jgi:hypothetical protein
MLDIPSISAIVAAIGVFIGVVLTVQELRHLVRQRQTDLITRLSYDISTNREFLGASMDVLVAEFNDYDDFVKKYGKLISKNPVPMSFSMIGNFYEQVGVLLKNKLIDASLVDQLLPAITMWEKIKPMVEGMREEYHDRAIFEWFEYLYNEMKKREQKLQQSKA